MTVNRIKVVVLGSPRCGKSAVVVRYLTKRYIGEYSSRGDMNYQHHVTFDGSTSEVEILDTSNCAKRGCLAEHLRWGDAFAVVYSVCERRSFTAAAELLALVERSRLPSCSAVTLLANKTDLEHARQVAAEEGQELSLRFGCQFYEVSAAESCAGAALAFHALLREARSLALLLPTPRRKLAAYSVSKQIIWETIPETLCLTSGLVIAVQEDIHRPLNTQCGSEIIKEKRPVIQLGGVSAMQCR